MKKPSFYEMYIKRGFDVVLSGIGAVVLLPVYALTAALIFIEDPGPVIFKQKRVGINKTHFQLYKFRSMRLDTPHDVPTHQLENPDQYILKTGKFIRKYSIDELPQLVNIIKGDMSIVGPRPALWNQFDLIKERDRYHANDVLPGLTGYAQINGRDELEIPVKAKMDGKYARALRKNSMTGFCIDFDVLVKTVASVLHSEGVVEGGTGAMKANENIETSHGNAGTNGISEISSPIGFYGEVTPDFDAKRKVLITGAGSYIGEYFKQYAEEKYKNNFEIETLDMLDPKWEEKSFSDIDVIYHVAGIAHADVGNVSDEVKAKYYEVNTNLTLKVAKKAKEEGVKGFVFMSSMIVYGESNPFGMPKMINKDTKMEPANFYGDSKYKADIMVRELADDNFKVSVLRPPMIYGKNSKGNYPTLAKMARVLPVFPEAINRRSMLYIENLCEFLCQMMLVPYDEFSPKGNIFIPQNDEYTQTSDMVRMIAEAKGHKIKIVKALDIFVKLGSKVPGKIGGLINKAFGNSCYEMSLSEYDGINYQIVSLEESVKRTEGVIRDDESTKPFRSNSKILILVNHEVVIYNFRLELVEVLLSMGYEVHISCPHGERIDELVKLGCIHHDIKFDRHGMNPVEELKLLINYIKLINSINPEVVLGYTIKPNIYGALASTLLKTPFLANITGLGTSVEGESLSKKIIIMLYKLAFKNVNCVFFQNKDDMKFFEDNNIKAKKYELLPGSGVNLYRYPVRKYPNNDDVVRFAFISRIMKEKGIDQYIEAAKAIKAEYPNTEFHVCGFAEPEYEGDLNKLNDEGVIIYHGMIKEVSIFMGQMHAIVHPTYYPEGLSNVLLEACATGRPIITTDRPGCREVVDDGFNGFKIPEKDADALIAAIKKFLSLSNTDKEKLGIAGRLKVEFKYSRQLVIDAYIREIKDIENG